MRMGRTLRPLTASAAVQHRSFESCTKPRKELDALGDGSANGRRQCMLRLAEEGAFSQCVHAACPLRRIARCLP